MSAETLAPVVTVNADFTDGPWSLNNVTAVMPGAVITFVQEGREVRFRDRLSRLIGVQQAGDTEAKRGSAVLWDNQRCEVLDRGITLAVEPDRGSSIQARFFQWALLKIDDELTVAAIAGHRPPRRDKHLWPAFVDSLDELLDFFEQLGIPVLVGIDTNALFPRLLARKLGLKWRGRGIDGFLYSHELVLGRARRMRPSRSDHRGVMSLLHIPYRRPA